jgi:D-alanyl-lipoteichoic acid acyltransferase DltB (MBOAT superfamily)
LSVLEGVSLAAATRDVVSMVGFRVLPVLGYLVVTRQLGIAPKILVLASAALVFILTDVPGLIPLGWIAAVYGYFVVASALVPFAVQSLRQKALTRGGLFVAAGAAFLVLPGLFFPEAARGAALLIGWDLALASYSYVVELEHDSAEPARSDCLFFLLVNPALVYTHRGERLGAPCFDRAGALRTAIGIATLFAGSALIMPACAYFKRHQTATGPIPTTVLGLVAFVVLRFLLEYARHSGLASLQLGLMRQIGHAVPERYRSPLLARNPTDFWQRWNTYVGGWIERYVFRPLVGRFRRGRRRAGLQAAYAISAVSAFAATGLLHDALPYLGQTGRVGVGFAAFSLIGLLAVGWAIVTRLVAEAAERLDASWLKRAEPVASRSAFWVLAFGCARLILD